MKLTRLISLAVALATTLGAAAKGTVRLQDYLQADSTSTVDAMPALRAALEDCARLRASELILPGGTLPLKPDGAFERYEYISNNDPSMKRIAFLLEGMKDFTVRGNGTRLLFSGFMSAFSLEGCERIRVENLSIDYERPFVSEGRIVAAGDGWFEFRFPDDYRVDLHDGSLRFRDAAGKTYPYSSLLEFDTERKEVAYHANDYWIWGQSYPAVKTAEGNWRLYRKDFGTAQIGNTMLFGATARWNPAFTLLDCAGFTLADVAINHCGGMGVIAQSSRDITLERVRVEPAEGSGRIVSISADATHFVNCKGAIRMIDCVFRNQKDDATNIHGWYMSIERRLADDRVLLRWRNSGQYGVRFLRPGMQIEVVDNRTMESYARVKIAQVRYLNAEYAEVRLAGRLPERVQPGHVVAEDGEYPDVEIRGCYIGNNRARGLLLGSRGRIVVEGCTFHTPGAAILFEGDGNYWYEQSGVRDVVIRDNVFDNCM